MFYNKILKKLIISFWVYSFMLASAQGTTLKDDSNQALLYCYSKKSVESGDHFPVLSGFLNSLFEAVVVNSALNGLGTKTLMGPQQSEEGIYTQFVRGFSIFDWRFTKLYLQKKLNITKPVKMAFATSFLDKETLDHFLNNSDENLKKVELLSKILFPNEKALLVRQMNDEDCKLEHDKNSFLPTKYKNDFYKNIDFWQTEIAKQSTPNKDSDLEKLRVFIRALVPFYFSSSVQMSPQSLGSVETTMILPPFYSLKTPNEDSIGSWSIEKGFRERALVKPIEVSNAQITDISYLPDTDFKTNNLIEVNLVKDLSSPQLFKVKARFGRLQKSNKEYVFDDSDSRDAFLVTFHPHFPASTSMIDPFLGFRDTFNSLFDDFIIDARIHRLGLNLVRPLNLNDRRYNTDVMFKTQFSMADSKISFRVHHRTNYQAQVEILKAMGFTCTNVKEISAKNYIRGNSNGQFYCASDYATFEELKSNFWGKIQVVTSDSTSWFSLDYLKNQMLVQGIRFFTDMIVPQVIPSIEEAIDREAGTIIDNILGDAGKSRDKISKRLQTALFTDRKL